MTRYKNINSGAQYNLFAEEKSVEKEVIADFEVKPAKAPAEEKKVADDDAQAFSALTSVKAAPSFRFISFGSGSSGNCAYLGTEKGGIIIDAGVDHASVACASPTIMAITFAMPML